jgi:hypothetical protein
MEGPDMGERIEKAKKIKKKEEKEKEKEKEGKGDKGSSGRPGSWSEGGSQRPAFRGSCYNCGMYKHSARYYGLGQGQGVKGFQGSCYTCGEWGHTSRGCPHSPPRSPGGWEQECSISIKNTEGVGSTEDKDKGRDNRVRDNKDKDSMVKDWGLQSETGRGLGEGEEGEKRKKGDRKR